MARKKFRDTKIGRSKLGKVASKVGTGIKKVGKGAAEVAAFTPLLPFRIVMSLALKKRGVSHKKTMRDITEKFYTVIVKGQPASYNEQENFAVATTVVIAAVVEFIKKLKEKKGRGEALDQHEKEILNGAEVASQAVEDAEMGKRIEKETGTQNFLATYGKWIAIAVAVGLLVLYLKKK